MRQAAKPAAAHDDYRFPSKAKPMKKQAPQEVHGEGSAVKTAYQPITPSKNVSGTFSVYMEGINTPYAEGTGDKPEGITAAPAPGNAETAGIPVLPLSFTGSALVQAVVMSEILKRPRASR